MKTVLPASYFLSRLTLPMLAAALMFLPSIAISQGPPGGGPPGGGPPGGGTPDEQPPSQETVCDGLEGAAFGICNSYCEATDCGDGVNYASLQACAALQRNWERKTGLTELPCDCTDGDVFIPGEGCGCAHDLLVRIIDFEPLGCPTGQGSCTYEMDIEVENLGSQDIVDPFSVMVELPGVGLGDSVAFPAGLGAGVVEQVLDIPLGPGDNCFDPNCEITATADPGNDIQECDEDNNTDFLEIIG